MACAAAIFQVLEQVSFGSLLSDIVIAKHHWLNDLNKVSCLSVCISVCLSGWLLVLSQSAGGSTIFRKPLRVQSAMLHNSMAIPALTQP